MDEKATEETIGAGNRDETGAEKTEAAGPETVEADEPKPEEPKTEETEAAGPEAEEPKAEERPDFLAEMERVESEEQLDDQEFLKARQERRERWKREEARRRKKHMWIAIGSACGGCAALGVVCGLILYFRSPVVKNIIVEAGGGTFGGRLSDGERVRYGRGVCVGYVGHFF